MSHCARLINLVQYPPPESFWQHCPNDREFLNKILRAYTVFVSVQKLENFIQLSVTLTKLCHINRDHLMNCYISSDKRQK